MTVKLFWTSSEFKFNPMYSSRDGYKLATDDLLPVKKNSIKIACKFTRKKTIRKCTSNKKKIEDKFFDKTPSTHCHFQIFPCSMKKSFTSNFNRKIFNMKIFTLFSFRDRCTIYMINSMCKILCIQ